MAKVVINNTDYLGFLSIYLNGYYPVTVNEGLHHARISNGIGGICVTNRNDIECVELHLTHEKDLFYLSNIEGDGILKVDAVNGVAPTSVSDLTNKLMELLV